MDVIQKLVTRRAHELEPGSRRIRSWEGLRQWWCAHSLSHVTKLEATTALPDPLGRRLREHAWQSLETSARQFVAIRRVLRPLLHDFDRYRRLDMKIGCWCRSFVVVAGGSIGRFEAGAHSDADLAVVVETDDLERCKEVVRGLIVWPLKLKLLEICARRHLPQPPLLDKRVLLFDHRWVLPDSTEAGRYRFTRRLLTCGMPLHDERTFAGWIAPYTQGGAEVPRLALLADLWQETDQQFAKVNARALGHPRYWEGWTKFVRLCLIGLGIRYRDVTEWRLNYFTLAERLRQASQVGEAEWPAIQRAVRWALRIGAEGEALDPKEVAPAVAAFRDLNEMARPLLQPRRVRLTDDLEGQSVGSPMRHAGAGARREELARLEGLR